MTASYIALRRLHEDNPNPHATPEPPPPAISTEIAVPADQVVTAVEGVFDEVVTNGYAFNAPMGVRFVARSEHLLSPEYDPDYSSGKVDSGVDVVAKIEVPFPVGRFKVSRPGIENRHITRAEMRQFAKDALEDIEHRLYDMSNQGKIDFARPHMGKTNTLTRQQLESFYDLDTWQSVHEEFDAFGLFDNGFTDDKGLSIR